MCPDRILNPGPLALESDALCGPACKCLQSIMTIHNIGTRIEIAKSVKRKNVGQCSTWLETLRCSHPDASADMRQ